MSRKGSRRLRILLDTSFLLPILGFDTSKRIISAYPRLREHELHYSDLSILEAMWKIIKRIRGTDEEVRRVAEGVEAMRSSMRSVAVDGESLQLAVRMYILGHKDMIDNLLYSVSLTQGLRLLTVDEELMKFIKREELPAHPIMLPEELGEP